MNSYKKHGELYDKPKEAIVTAEENSKAFQTSHKRGILKINYSY